MRSRASGRDLRRLDRRRQRRDHVELAPAGDLRAARDVDRAQLDRRPGQRAHDRAGVGGVGQQPQPRQHVADLGPLEERRLADQPVRDRALLQRHAHRLALVGDLGDEHRHPAGSDRVARQQVLDVDRHRLGLGALVGAAPQLAFPAGRAACAELRSCAGSSGRAGPAAPRSRPARSARGSAGCARARPRACPPPRSCASGPRRRPGSAAGPRRDRPRSSPPGAPTPPGPASRAPGRAPGRRRAAGSRSAAPDWAGREPAPARTRSGRRRRARPPRPASARGCSRSAANSRSSSASGASSREPLRPRAVGVGSDQLGLEPVDPAHEPAEQGVGAPAEVVVAQRTARRCARPAWPAGHRG